MSKLTIEKVENAFLPAKEIESPSRFAGRKKQVQDLYYALIATGTNIAIVGNRGIGKSSLARQLIAVSTGNNDLLQKLGLPNDKQFDFLTFYLACGGGVKSYKELLEKLLTTKSCLLDWIYDVPTARKEIESYTPNLSAGIVSLGGKTEKETASTSVLGKHDIETVFTNVLIAVAEAKVCRDGILIVVDEFDQIDNPRGFAGMLKSLATNVPKVKFCLVGVAQDIQNLMREHESSDRLFAGGIVPLPPMSEVELKEIVRIAELSIDSAIQFDSGGADELVILAQGHPYMVHLIGKYALRSAFKENRQIIARSNIKDTLREIAESGADPVLEGRYKKAVASSPARETVLKSLAKARTADGEIWTTDSYQIALQEGVDNPSQYVGHLVTSEYGGEVVKVRERYYRFKDSLFYAYVSARPRIFNPSDASPLLPNMG